MDPKMNSFGPLFEGILATIGTILEHLGPSWGHLGPMSEPSWAILRASREVWGAFGGHLGTSWSILRAAWEHLEAILRQKSAKGGLDQCVPEFLWLVLGLLWDPKLN